MARALGSFLVVAAGHAYGAPGCGRRPCSRAGSRWWRPSEQQGQQQAARPSGSRRRAAGRRQGGDGGRPGVVVASPGCRSRPATTSPDLLPTRAGKIPGGWTCCSRRAPSTSLSRCCLPVPVGDHPSKSRCDSSRWVKILSVGYK
jgi:hypothetical protein